MTQKELLYVEDAVSHESSIIKICNGAISKLEDNNLISFMENEITKHENIKKSLLDLLRGQSNGE